MTVLKGMAIRMPMGISKAMATATAVVEVPVMEPMAMETISPQQQMLGGMVGETLGFNPKTSVVTLK